ncbi:hypothetical protein Hgul01_05066 [Herpetosiphon gulosus]|uniref:Uncharacterized protein n=1 Tax=Herpetosiphon gulosus TaxID=1973496 RepID=A0ABP9X789_9CHLR
MLLVDDPRISQRRALDKNGIGYDGNKGWPFYRGLLTQHLGLGFIVTLIDTLLGDFWHGWQKNHLHEGVFINILCLWISSSAMTLIPLRMMFIIHTSTTQIN